MKFNLTSLLGRFKALFSIIRDFRYLIFGTIIVGLFGFTVWRIDYLSSPARDNEVYQEQLSQIDKIEFDEAAIERILELHDTDVKIAPKFPGDRINPF